MMLRHQLNVLRRRVASKPKLAVADRLLFVWLYRLVPSTLKAIAIVQPVDMYGLARHPRREKSLGRSSAFENPAFRVPVGGSADGSADFIMKVVGCSI